MRKRAATLAWIRSLRYRALVHKITLREAVERWQREDHVETNAYDWYRRDAASDRAVSFGSVDIPAHKPGREWVVDEADVARAIIAHRQHRDDVTQATTDLAAGRLHGKDGDSIETEWGSYSRRDPFHLRERTDIRPWKESGETWYCSGCMRPASTEHNNPECHRCSDWSPCGRDCSLSRVSCSRCGTGFAVPSGTMLIEDDAIDLA
jgi:hypothetical protein